MRVVAIGFLTAALVSLSTSSVPAAWWWLPSLRGGAGEFARWSLVLPVGLWQTSPLAAAREQTAVELRPVGSLLDGVQIHVSSELIARETLRSLDKHVAVRDVILGVPIRGDAHVVGTTRLELVENPTQGEFEFVLSGTAVSATVGDAGKARIHSRTVTRFTARKQFILDERGLRALPAQCRAEAHSTVTRVSSPLPRLRGRLARRIAWRRAQSQLAAADRVGARHSEREISLHFDADIAMDVRRANQWLAQQRANADVATSGCEFQPRFQTSADRLRVTGLTARLIDLAASGQTADHSNVAMKILIDGGRLVVAVGTDR